MFVLVNSTSQIQRTDLERFGRDGSRTAVLHTWLITVFHSSAVTRDAAGGKYAVLCSPGDLDHWLRYLLLVFSLSK